MTRSLAKRHLPLPNTVCTLTCPCESEMIALFLLRMVIVDLEPSDIPSTNQVLPRPCCPMHCTVLYCTMSAEQALSSGPGSQKRAHPVGDADACPIVVH